MARMQNILIALPTVSQTVKSSTTLTIASVVRALTANGVGVDLHNIDSAEIVTARDMFANMVFHSPKWDGLLFIDSDMAFEAELALRMWERGEDLVAAACPRRSFDLDRFLVGMRNHGTGPRAVAEASDFTVKFDWEGKKLLPDVVENGFCAAAAVGMACVLISKNVLKTMVERKVVAVRPDLQASAGKCWSFFKPIETKGQRLGEDYSFCYRWTAQLKKPLHVCVDEPVSHIGTYDYRARYADLL